MVESLGFSKSKIVRMAQNRFVNPSLFGSEVVDREDSTFENTVNSSMQCSFNEGDIIEGTITSVDKDDVIVDVGLKSEGRVPIKEFDLGDEHESLEVGSKVKVCLDRIEGRNGNIVLSREKAIREEYWSKLEACAADKIEVEGVIFASTKCGFTVDIIGGVVAFLPASHVDLKQVKDITPLLGKKLKFLILKMDKKQGNIVVSRKAVLEASHMDAKNEFLQQLNEGDIIEGKVKSITNYGVFIGIHESNEVGVVDGLLHITDISWSRVSHPSAIFSCGQTARVKIIKIDRENGRISLGVKQLEKSPWENVGDRYPAGSIHKGTITSIEDYGIFVELDFGIEGLVHVSEISWTKNTVPINQLFSRGQEIDVKILSTDVNKTRMSLSIKRCSDNPWQVFSSKYPAGSIISGKIKNIVDFGIFVDFDDPRAGSEIDGLIHSNDLSWSNNPESEIKSYSVGDEVQAKILRVNVNRGRISLGIKQLGYDPFEEFLKKISLGDMISVMVSKIEDTGILVEVSNGSAVLIEQEYLPTDVRFSVGERLEAEVLSIEKYNVILAVKA